MKQSHSSLFSQSVGVPCDFRMSKRVPAILVAGRIQGREIVILDLFVADGLPHELGGLCPSSIEGISRIERGWCTPTFLRRHEGPDRLFSEQSIYTPIVRRQGTPCHERLGHDDWSFHALHERWHCPVWRVVGCG